VRPGLLNTTFTQTAREGTSVVFSRAKVSVYAFASLSVPIHLLSSVYAFSTKD